MFNTKPLKPLAKKFRAPIAVILYMMVRYGFTLSFCMDFMKFKINS